MDYYKKLVIRISLALLLLLVPINIFYFIFLKPTLLLSFITLNAYNPTVISDSLIINNEILRFVPACIATSAYYLLVILILLTKDLKFGKALKLFLVGAFVIFIANIARIDLLVIALLEFGIEWFDRLHLFIWEFLSTIFIAILWIFLTRKFDIKTIPAYSDLRYLMKESRK